MRVAVWANILDCIAFFLVTIDLYGRERLSNLSGRLRQVSRKRINILEFWKSTSGWGEDNTAPTYLVILGWLLSLPLGIYIVFIPIFYLIQWSSGTHHSFWDYSKLALLLAVGVDAGVIFLFGLIWAIILIFRALSGILNFIYTNFNIDGVMLICGAAIFALSRLLTIWGEIGRAN